MEKALKWGKTFGYLGLMTMSCPSKGTEGVDEELEVANLISRDLRSRELSEISQPPERAELEAIQRIPL